MTAALAMDGRASVVGVRVLRVIGYDLCNNRYSALSLKRLQTVSSHLTVHPDRFNDLFVTNGLLHGG